jgi:predicted RNase H-like nuclease (RuvC/YqgF family)
VRQLQQGLHDEIAGSRKEILGLEQRLFDSVRRSENLSRELETAKRQLQTVQEEHQKALAHLEEGQVINDSLTRQLAVERARVENLTGQLRQSEAVREQLEEELREKGEPFWGKISGMVAAGYASAKQCKQTYYQK